MNPSNTISVATLIAEIQSELNDQTGSWREVSGLLNKQTLSLDLALTK
jgi:hypothetical protein